MTNAEKLGWGVATIALGTLAATALVRWMLPAKPQLVVPAPSRKPLPPLKTPKEEEWAKTAGIGGYLVI